MSAPVSRRLALASSEVGWGERGKSKRGAKHEASRALRRTEAEHVVEHEAWGLLPILAPNPWLTTAEILELYEPWYEIEPTS